MNIMVNVRRGHSADAYFRGYAPWSMCSLFSNHTIRVDQAKTSDVLWADVMVFQRSATAEDEVLMREAKALGKRVIYDVDDNLFDIPPSCPDIFTAYWVAGKGTPTSRMIFHQRMLQLADRVTVPTAELGALLCERVGKELPIRVAPNLVLRGDWDALTPMESRPPGCNEETVLLGWMGYIYHWDDWYDLRHVLDRALAEENARLVIMGFPEVRRAFPPRLRAKTLVEPVVAFADFAAMRRMMATVDVALLPLSDSPFNWGKSPLKALQFGLAGVPIMASEIVYGKLFAPGEDAPMFLLPPDPAAWEEALPPIIHAAREKRLGYLAQAWREQVVRKHCLESPRADRVAPMATMWLDICEEVASE